MVRDHGRTRLSSVVYKTLWEPRRELSAACRGWRLSLPRFWRREALGHDAPAEQCRCGIYGAAEPRRAVAYLHPRYADFCEDLLPWPLLDHVIGRVFLWGSILECERGWRASSAYPQELFVPLHRDCDDPERKAAETADGLSVYGVPVELLPCGAYDEIEGILALRPAA